LSASLAAGAVVGIVGAVVTFLAALPDQAISTSGVEALGRASGIVVIAPAVIALLVALFVAVTTRDREAGTFATRAALLARRARATAREAFAVLAGLAVLTSFVTSARLRRGHVLALGVVATRSHE
jgi:hypothetical protein